MSDQQQPQGELRIDVAEQEVGIFADFVSLWNTPSTFVLDFVALKTPMIRPPEGELPHVDGRVAARVRLPAEQIYPLIEALQRQGAAWLAATGRSEPPPSWFTPPAASPAEGGDDPEQNAEDRSEEK